MTIHFVAIGPTAVCGADTRIKGTYFSDDMLDVTCGPCLTSNEALTVCTECYALTSNLYRHDLWHTDIDHRMKV